MTWLFILKWVVTLICLVLCTYECYHVINKLVAKDSFQAVNELQFDRLLSPSLTLCPGTAWKSPGK